MPEGLHLALATPGLGWMAFTIFCAGIVRGFTGFGTALIFVPVAAQYLPMVEVIPVIMLTGLVTATALMPTAWRAADKPEVAVLVAAVAVTAPFGLWLMSVTEALTLRWIVTGVVLLTLAAVVTGWRWHGRLGWGGRLGIGGASGVIGGMTGLTGPVVITFYLANARSAQAVRANTILFLASCDIVIIASLAVSGQVAERALWLAPILSAPYLVTALIGQALFDPAYETLYRRIAYGVVFLAVISGLPLLD